MATVYAVASAKGGVGKTTTTAALATTLAAAGADVVAIDADLGMANLADVVGVTPDGVTVHDVLAGEADPEAAVREGPFGLRVVPGATDLDAYAAADPAGLRGVVEAFDGADYVFVDAGAGLSHDSTLPLAIADEALLVSTPERSALGDTEKTRQLTERLGGTVAGAAITRVTEDADEVVAALLDAPVLGRVPEDEAVARTVAAGRPLLEAAPDAPATRAYRDLTRALTGADVEGAGLDDPGRDTARAAATTGRTDEDAEGGDRAETSGEDRVDSDEDGPDSDDGDEEEDIIVADPDPSGVTKPGDGDDIVVADESEPTETDADATGDTDAGAVDAGNGADDADGDTDADSDDTEAERSEVGDATTDDAPEPEAAEDWEPADEAKTEPADGGDNIPDADETARGTGVDREEGDDRAGAEPTASGDDVDDELAGSIPFRDDDSGSMNTVLSERDGGAADGDENPTEDPAEGSSSDEPAEKEQEESREGSGFFSRLFGR
jgi:septum site-determining protein MinD